MGSSPIRVATPQTHLADLAHLVERDLAKVEVAGSSPVIRSTLKCGYELKKFVSAFHSQRSLRIFTGRGKGAYPESTYGAIAKR